jgi:hypothetical protein
MNEAATITFSDLDSGDEALAIVRYDDHCVCVGLSLKSDGDIQVVMEKDKARALLEALQLAVQ